MCKCEGGEIGRRRGLKRRRAGFKNNYVRCSPKCNRYKACQGYSYPFLLHQSCLRWGN